MKKKFTLRKKIVSCLMATVFAFAGTGGAILIQNPVSVSASEAIADTTSKRSISVYKYSVKDGSELGERGDGTFDPTIVKELLPGIKFKVERVIAQGGASLVNPLDSVLGTDYIIDSTFAAQTITTGTDGKATIDLGTGRTNDGIYLLTEQPDDRTGADIVKVAKPADPFFVYVPQTSRADLSSLIYDVVVQPKNILESLINPQKTVENGAGYSIKAGQNFNWEATANVPSQLYYKAANDGVITPLYDDNGAEIPAPNNSMTVKKGQKIFADYFTMSDTIAKDLTLLNVKMQVQKDGGAWEDLDATKDYTVTVDGTAGTTGGNTAEKVVVASLVKPSGTESPIVGMEKVQGYDKIRVVYTTKTDVDYNGVITNQFDVKYKSPGLKPVDVPSNVPEYFNGGFDLEKLGEDTNAALAGAVFHLATTQENAEKNIFIGVDGKNYGKADGTGTVADSEALAVAAGTTLLTSTSDSTGKATFNGLKLQWFTDTNSNGTQDTDEPTWAHDDIKQDYWIVETTAPDGYELLKKPEVITVTLSTKNTVVKTIVDKKKTDLPFSGGTGTAIIVAIALGAITVGAVAITVDKKRRKNA